MERHEYRDENFWKTLDKTDYAVISSINCHALKQLIDIMRGSRTIEKYAYDCGLTASTLYRTCNGTRKQPLQYEYLLSLYEQKEPNCGVYFEHLLAANGMAVLKDVFQLQEQILKETGIHAFLYPDQTSDGETAVKACAELKKMIDKMRGDRGYAEYALECGLTKNTLVYIAAFRRRCSLSNQQLKTLYEHRAPNCKVSLGDLLRINRLFPLTGNTNKARLVTESLNPDTLDSNKDKTCSKNTCNYNSYLEDLAFYLMKRPEQMETLKKKCTDIFENKNIVQMLHDFHMVSEKEWESRVGAVRSFFENKSNLELPVETAGSLLKKLDLLLISEASL